jgi:fermentation-respiration switch protein FrsA (DUF1100 family)
MFKFLLIFAAGYGLLLAVVYLVQSRMLYLPNTPGRDLVMTPADAGMEFDDITLETDDGVGLHGWFIPGRSSRVLIFFHGNAGNISHRLGSISQFHNLGLSVLIIDYRGYGRSGGRPTEDGMYRDAEAAWQYFVADRGLAPGDIIIFGRSLGASVAAKLATLHTPLALIVESSFTSVPEIAADIYPWLPVRLLSRLSHATRDYVGEVRCPVLVIHSHDDEIIPFSHGLAIFEAAPEPRTIVALHGSHNDAHLVDVQTYLRALSGFLGGLPRRGQQGSGTD